MGDDNLSASELRQRFLKGGSIPDNELSAQQLRARHAIPSNSKDFSTRAGDGDGSSMVIIVVIAVMCFALGLVFFSKKQDVVSSS